MRSSPQSFVGPLLWCLLVLAEGRSEEVTSRESFHHPAYAVHPLYQADVSQRYANLVMADVINRLGMELLAIQNENDENNIAISPYGALSVLIALGEGLQGDAVREIQLAARIPNDISVIRQGLRYINRQLQSYFIPKEGFLAGLTLNYDDVVLKPQYEDILLYYGFDITAFNVALYPTPKLPPVETTSTSHTSTHITFPPTNLPLPESTITRTTPTHTTSTNTTVAELSSTTQTTAPTALSSIEVFDSTTNLYTSTIVGTTTGITAPDTTTIISQKSSGTMESPLPTVPSAITTTSLEMSTTIPATIQKDMSSTIVDTPMTGELMSTNNTSEVNTIPTFSINTRTITTLSDGSTMSTISSGSTPSISPPTAMRNKNSLPATSTISITNIGTTNSSTTSSYLSFYINLDAMTLSKLKQLMTGDDSSKVSTENTSTSSVSTTLEAISFQTTSVYSRTELLNDMTSTAQISTETATDGKIEDKGQSTTEVPVYSTLTKWTTGQFISTDVLMEDTTKQSISTTERQIMTIGAMITETTDKRITSPEAMLENITEQQTTLTEAMLENTKEEQITTGTMSEQFIEQQTATGAMKEMTTEQHFSTTEAVVEMTAAHQTITTEGNTERHILSTDEDRTAAMTTETMREMTIEQNLATDAFTTGTGFASASKQKRMTDLTYIYLNNWYWTDSLTHKRVAKSVANYIKYQKPFYHTTDSYPRRSTGEEPSYFLSQGRYKDYNVNFMRYITMLPICNVAHLDARALKFPLDRKEYYLLILLPNRDDGVDALVRDLRFNGNLRQIVEGLRIMHVDVTVPSFRIEGYLKLTNLFQRLGIKKVFEPNQGDFTPMTNQKQIYVLNIEQAITVNIKHYVDIGYINRKHSSPWKFKADHPFLFFVMDSQLQVSLMSGKITNPLNTRIS